jgi:hypothetical protein
MMIVVTRDPSQPIRTVQVRQMRGGTAVVETQGAVTAGRYPEGVTAMQVEQEIAKWMARSAWAESQQREDKDNGK